MHQPESTLNNLNLNYWEDEIDVAQAVGDVEGNREVMSFGKSMTPPSLCIGCRRVHQGLRGILSTAEISHYRRAKAIPLHSKAEYIRHQRQGEKSESPIVVRAWENHVPSRMIGKGVDRSNQIRFSRYS